MPAVNEVIVWVLNSHFSTVGPVRASTLNRPGEANSLGPVAPRPNETVFPLSGQNHHSMWNNTAMSLSHMCTHDRSKRFIALAVIKCFVYYRRATVYEVCLLSCSSQRWKGIWWSFSWRMKLYWESNDTRPLRYYCWWQCLPISSFVKWSALLGVWITVLMYTLSQPF